MNEFTKLAADLRAAKALIAAPATWTQGNYALDQDEQPVRADDPDAVCFCSIGAIECLSKNVDSWQQRGALKDAVPIGSSIISFNDSHTHAEVMGVWNKAIATAEANAVVLNLEMAKEKIALKNSWTKGGYATDIEGNAVDTTDASAACFCAFGAIEVVTAKPHQMIATRQISEEPEYKFLNEATIAVYSDYDFEAYGESAAGYNDAPTTTHADILALFDAAIVLAKAAV